MKLLLPATLGAALFATANHASAQYTFPLHPFSQTGDLFVSEPGDDRIYRLQDLDLDGRYDSPGETIVFYDSKIGPVPLTNPNGITVGLNGIVYVSDSSQEFVLRLVDLDGDGSCHGPGEATIYYDGNGGGVTMASPQNLTVDLPGTVYVSVAGDGANSQDRIVMLQDTNFDGVITPNEAVVLYDFPAGPGGANIPQDIQVGPDMRLYFVENGTGVAKGVYRMDDANLDGTYTHDEVQPFFVPPPQSATAFFWGMSIDAEGFFYIADTGNDVIWRFRDENGDGTVDSATEAVIWWQAPGASLIWRVAAASDGSMYAAESQAPDRILRLEDLDGDGVVDPFTEVIDVWSDLVSDVDMTNPRSIAFERHPTVAVVETTSIASPLPIGVFATVGDFVVLYWSAAALPDLPLAPFGFLGIDPSVAGLLAMGQVPLFGPLTVTVPALHSPGLIGATVHFQGLVGKAARLRLTNAVATTFQP